VIEKKKKKEKVIVDAPAAFVRRVLNKAPVRMVCAHFCFTLSCEDCFSILPSSPDISLDGIDIMYMIKGTVSDLLMKLALIPLYLACAPALGNSYKLTTIFFALTPFFATANASSIPSRPLPAT
jgi:hypothetical protein